LPLIYSTVRQPIAEPLQGRLQASGLRLRGVHVLLVLISEQSQTFAFRVSERWYDAPPRGAEFL